MLSKNSGSSHLALEELGGTLSSWT